MPNTPVYVDYRGVRACYPRGNFYPMIDGPSTQRHRVTWAGFRPCSRCLCRSQARLCPYTPRLIANQPERTFARLRYPLGVNRPSQTVRLALSPSRFDGSGLESQHPKGGISRTTPSQLAPGLHSLPPILHNRCQDPMPNSSKAPRGLFVLPRVTGVFTGASISPSPSLRQRWSRYTIHARRNFT